jgi:hypothetical protein
MAASVSQGRRSHQRRIAALLDDLEHRRRRLSVLRARGAQPAGLRGLKAELQAVRDELAAAVNVEGPLRSRAARPRVRAATTPRSNDPDARSVRSSASRVDGHGRKAPG